MPAKPPAFINIGWKVSTISPNLASVRYRALLPLIALEQRGCRCRIFSRPSRQNLDGLDLLVIVKSFEHGDVNLAQEANARGIPVVFDLCDNIFIADYKGKNQISPAEIFLTISRIASAIVTTTEPLAQVIRDVTKDAVPVFVAPDGIECVAMVTEGKRRLRQARWRDISRSVCGGFRRAAQLLFDQHAMRAALTPTTLRKNKIYKYVRRALGRWRKFGHWRFWAKIAYRCFDTLRTRLRARPVSAVASSVSNGGSQDVKRILWFGNHGAAHAKFGMLDLLQIRDSLERIAQDFPVELVVVSNNVEKYGQFIAPMRIPSRYVEWNVDAMNDHLRRADVVVLPNSLDPFSACKSANRAVLSLSQGVPVVATSTSALEPLRGCIELDDFYLGLRRYLTDPAYMSRHVAEAQLRIDRHFGMAAIGEAWLHVFDKIRRHGAVRRETEAALIVCLNLIQDLDLAVPILREAQAKGLSHVVWLSESLYKKSPRVSTTLAAMNVCWRTLPNRINSLSENPLPRGAKAFLTVSETNLGPHRFTHCLTKLAARAGLATYTIQHGFENVGLTYDDAVHPIEKISFASARIFTWGASHTLHPKISRTNRAKCVPVGCPKPAASEPADLDGLLPIGRPVVGVFENLHWHRYSDDYRTFFLEGVQCLAEAFPHVTFLIKPHHAGLWLTVRHKGDRPTAGNVIIADPQSSAWERYTATHLLGRLDAVITSPSTVALDAARAGLPVAVVAHEMNLTNYQPLFQIRCDADWRSFMLDVTERRRRDVALVAAQQFIDRVILPDDAAAQIVLNIGREVSNVEMRVA
jgi:hypothetical protein